MSVPEEGAPTTARGQRPPAPRPGGAAAPFTDAYGNEMESPKHPILLTLKEGNDEYYGPTRSTIIG